MLCRWVLRVPEYRVAEELGCCGAEFEGSGCPGCRGSTLPLLPAAHVGAGQRGERSGERELQHRRSDSSGVRGASGGTASRPAPPPPPAPGTEAEPSPFQPTQGTRKVPRPPGTFEKEGAPSPAVRPHGRPRGGLEPGGCSVSPA